MPHRGLDNGTAMHKIAAGSKQSRRKSSVLREVNSEGGVRDKSVLFARKGFAGQLCGLGGNLAKYNGEQVNPEPYGPKRYHVRLDGMELVVKEANLDVVVDYTHNDSNLSYFDTVGSKKKKGDGAFRGNNRSNVQQVFDDLANQLKSAVKREAKSKGGIMEVFKAFDSDGSGAIEKNEFQQLCQVLKLHLTHEQMDLIYAFLDSVSVASDQSLECAHICAHAVCIVGCRMTMGL